MTVTIRRYRPSDAAAVRELLIAAFDERAEAQLVDLLRASPGYVPALEFVAEQGVAIVGHTMLTTVNLRRPDDTEAAVLCLSPLAVRPDRQRAGIGRSLVTHALRAADACGEPMVVLEGDPALYRRFGFEPASGYGLTRPSPTIPEPAFQVRRLAGYDSSWRGRVSYPVSFWATCGAGLPEPVADGGPLAVPWLFQLARYAGWIEAASADADLDRAVPTCPGWALRDLLQHLGVVHRMVPTWIHSGQRPREAASRPDRMAVRDWFGEGWRALYSALAALPPETPVSTWSPHEATALFWRRRMVHETAIHALDVLTALSTGPAWSVPDPVAWDGVDEALRLWLGVRLGDRLGGSGWVVRLDAGGRTWLVALGQRVQVSDGPGAADARVNASPATLYAWLWGRVGDDALEISGDAAVVGQLRRALARAT